MAIFVEIFMGLCGVIKIEIEFINSKSNKDSLKKSELLIN